MVNKEIYIDGVDVSGCCCYENGKCLWTKRYYENNIVPDCKKVKNCHYKNWQRKEQECEELKEEIKKHNDDMFKNPPEKRFYCKGCTLPYISKKQSQTLTEIKEISQNVIKNVSDRCIETTPMYYIHKQILQKISECEGNDG